MRVQRLRQSPRGAEFIPQRQRFRDAFLAAGCVDVGNYPGRGKRDYPEIAAGVVNGPAPPLFALAAEIVLEAGDDAMRRLGSAGYREESAPVFGVIVENISCRCNYFEIA